MGFLEFRKKPPSIPKNVVKIPYLNLTNIKNEKLPWKSFPISHSLCHLWLQAYRGFDNSKRQIFQNSLVTHIRRCFIFMIEVNRSKKGGNFKRDEAVDRVINFVINAMRALTVVELDKENSAANMTVIETESVVTTVLKGNDYISI